MAQRTPDSPSLDSYSTLSKLAVGQRSLTYYSLPTLGSRLGLDLRRLPVCLRILLENLLRHEDGTAVSAGQIQALAKWDAQAEPSQEIAFNPARVVLQDFTGVPAVVDLAVMRDAVAELGGDPDAIEPLLPAELVIDHSVQVDAFGSADALVRNAREEYARNGERYALLRWAQTAFQRFKVVPPATGIVHQVNLEYLARVVFEEEGLAYPDTVVGTDSHTTMINGLGVLGWGVGGIEAEAAMLGQPIAMLVPHVVGFELQGMLSEGATATDLVLAIAKVLRQHGVVGKLVEFFGSGLDQLPLADRATISNMAPEFGCTAALFPVDAETLAYLRNTGREPDQVRLIEAYFRAQGLFRTTETPNPVFTAMLRLDLSTVVPAIAGPRRPQDKVPLTEAKDNFLRHLPELAQVPGRSLPDLALRVPVELDGTRFELAHGQVVIAAITSCTNTSNPAVMLGAGLLARNAVRRGLRVKPWVKTSLAPGSKVVTRYLERSGVLSALEALRFHVVGYGCTTCIGNSGPLPEPIGRAIREHALVAVSVLSGNRNFEGRISPDTRANYLMSPPLVVAYALVGRMDFDFEREPIGLDPTGQEVFLRDIWPSTAEVTRAVEAHVLADLFRAEYGDVFNGDEQWRSLPVPEGSRFTWEPTSTYVRRPTFFDHLPPEPAPPRDIQGARVLAVLGDTVTTDHISPAGNIAKDSPAARYLLEHGVPPSQWNSYGARRGNHEVMVRGTFANVRLRNLLAAGTEGGWTRHLPGGELLTIYDAACRYARENTPLLVLAGKDYGAGSSRDWAAKGTRMLGVVAVLAESYERIHRSNLLGMGVLPLQYVAGQNRESLGISGEEAYDVVGVATDLAPGCTLRVRAVASDGNVTAFDVLARIDTAVELEYFRHSGILPYVLRQLLNGSRFPAGQQ